VRVYFSNLGCKLNQAELEAAARVPLNLRRVLTPARVGAVHGDLLLADLAPAATLGGSSL